jgi:hypothetical protein
MGEHQLTIRDYLRQSNLYVTNKYLRATSKPKRLADKLVDAVLPIGYFAEDKPNSMRAVCECFSGGTILAQRLSSPNIPDWLDVRVASA